MFPVSHDIYAVVPTRLWGAPWRWNLTVYRFVPNTAANHVAYTEDEIVATNITKAECIGLMKLLGYEQEIKC